jgi:hypothetical protein
MIPMGLRNNGPKKKGEREEIANRVRSNRAPEEDLWQPGI